MVNAQSRPNTWSLRQAATALTVMLMLAAFNPALAGEKGVEVQTSAGTTVHLTRQALDESRDYQYCELVFIYEGDVGADIYSTSPLAPCDLDWWNNLDMQAIADDLGAKMAIKNGPQWWSMDEVRVMGSEPVEIGGVDMIFVAHLPAGTMSIPKYTVFSPAKTQYIVWEAGKPTYRLIDADGHAYLLQGHKVPTHELDGLGGQFKNLPEGWSYNVVVPDEDLVFDLTPDEPIPSVQDEFDQIYIRIPN